jgi:hypothetical protein
MGQLPQSLDPLRRCEIVGELGQDVPDATAGIIHISQVPWNDVKMEVEDRLTSRMADVQADIVSVRPIAQLDRSLGRVYCSD